MLPQEWVDFVNKGGLFALGIAFVWGLHTGRLILPREVDFIKLTYEARIAELVRRLENAERELSQQQALLQKVAETYYYEQRRGQD